METSYIRTMSNFPILVKTPLIFPIPWAPAPFPKRGLRALHTLNKYDTCIISTLDKQCNCIPFGPFRFQLGNKQMPVGYCRVSAGLKFTSDILSKQPQYCSDIWKIFRTFLNTHFYHHKQKLPSALLILKPGVVLLPFRMVSAA